MTAAAQPGQPARSAREARASVEVPVDPQTAFAAFTEEIDQWWVPGPINYFDAARAVAMRIEPGLGGRVLEQYADDPPLVIAEVTTWVPGERMGWRGVVDDSQTEIGFTPTEVGTRVDVHQFLRPDGDRAFLFWPNVVTWYDAHLAHPARSAGGAAR